MESMTANMVSEDSWSGPIGGLIQDIVLMQKTEGMKGGLGLMLGLKCLDPMTSEHGA
jgi:hypothetical protein